MVVSTPLWMSLRPYAAQVALHGPAEEGRARGSVGGLLCVLGRVRLEEVQHARPVEAGRELVLLERREL